MRTRSSLFALSLVFVLGFGVLLLPGEAKTQMAPPWTLKDLSGKTVKLSDYKGKILVLNFWATWCPPCLQEIPEFIEIEKEYRGKGVEVVGISTDSFQPAEVAVYVKRLQINYPILMSNDEVEEKYDTADGIPITLIIDPTGKIVDRQLGIVDKAYLEGQIKALLPTLKSK